MSKLESENVTAPVTSQPVVPTGPAFPAANVTPQRAMSGSSVDAIVSSSGCVRATITHDKDMARTFLAGLDRNATKFTFQFFSDCGDRRHTEIFHGTLDEVWPKVQLLNTAQHGVGVFVTINETDFKGRSSKNIVRARALFADADSEEQSKRCFDAFNACSTTPGMVVETDRGTHFYFCTDVPLNQFRTLQSSLIDALGTDPAVKDLPRVMRLPGTLHLKDPTNPRFVKLIRTSIPVPRWNLSDLIAKLRVLLWDTR
jgi:DNA primase RepB-like protein